MKPSPEGIGPRCASVYAGVWADAAPGLRCERREHPEPGWRGPDWIGLVHQAEAPAGVDGGSTRTVSWL